jgi:hypothetical protein
MVSSSAKGKSLEREFADWMKSNLGYSKTELRVPITGKVSERSYEVDIHAIRYSRIMNTIRVIGVIVLVVAIYAHVAEDKQITNVAARIVQVVSPQQTGNALYILGGAGVIGGFWGKSKTKVHAWVECKNQKCNVKRHQIQKLMSSIEDVRALDEPKWCPKHVFLVPATDFDPDALNFARGYDVTCYRKTSDGFELALG